MRTAPRPGRHRRRLKTGAYPCSLNVVPAPSSPLPRALAISCSNGSMYLATWLPIHAAYYFIAADASSLIRIARTAEAWQLAFTAGATTANWRTADAASQDPPLDPTAWAVDEDPGFAIMAITDADGPASPLP